MNIPPAGNFCKHPQYYWQQHLPDLHLIIKKNKPLLSFSTLGCPDWTFQQIIDFAVQHDYKGIELRGIQRELDLTKCNEFSSHKTGWLRLAIMKEKACGLLILDLPPTCILLNPQKEKKI